MTVQETRVLRNRGQFSRPRYQARCPDTGEWFTVSLRKEVPATAVCPCCGIRWGLTGLKWKGIRG